MMPMVCFECFTAYAVLNVIVAYVFASITVAVIVASDKSVGLSSNTTRILLFEKCDNCSYVCISNTRVS